MPKDPNELGALWEKESAKGRYFTGLINGERVVVFANKNKTSTKQPDWRILKAQPKPQTDAPSTDEPNW